jgi:hypothetical protein
MAAPELLKEKNSPPEFLEEMLKTKSNGGSISVTKRMLFWGLCFRPHNLVRLRSTCIGNKYVVIPFGF